MESPAASTATSPDTDVVAVPTPPPRSVVAVAHALLALAAVGGANFASFVLGFGHVATSSLLANTLLGLGIALLPRCAARLLQPSPDAMPRPLLRTLATAAGTTLLDLLWLLLLTPFLLLGGGIAAGAAEFLLFGPGRFLLAGLLVVTLIALRRPRAHDSKVLGASAANRSSGLVLRAASWLWLLAWVGLTTIVLLEPWESVGTDPRDGSHYFARPQRRDMPRERHTLFVATPLLGDAIRWHHVVGVEPSLPVDLSKLRFEGDAVFAERRDGVRVRLALR